MRIKNYTSKLQRAEPEHQAFERLYHVRFLTALYTVRVQNLRQGRSGEVLGAMTVARILLGNDDGNPADCRSDIDNVWPGFNLVWKLAQFLARIINFSFISHKEVPALHQRALPR